MTTITTTYKGDMLFQTRIGNHSLLADVPPVMGGKDRAPTPPELFIASPGTCVGALVAQYCGRGGKDAGDMTIKVEFTKAEQPTRLTDHQHAKCILPGSGRGHSPGGGTLSGASNHCDARGHQIRPV